MRSKNLPCRRDPPAGAAAVPAGEEAAHLGPLLAEILAGVRDLRELLAGVRKEWYTVEELAALTGRSAYTVRRWIATGRLKATRVACAGPRGRLLVARDQLQGLIASGLGGEVPAALGG
jgi:excisionase family DNA binding protein